MLRNIKYLVLCWLFAAVSLQASVINQAQVVTKDAATAALVPEAKRLDVVTAGNYTITLTDVVRANSTSGAPFTSLSLVITQGDQLVKLVSVLESTGSSGVATAMTTLAPGSYTVQVLGATSGASAYAFDITGASGSVLSDGGAVNASTPSNVLSKQVDLQLTSGQSYFVSLQDLAMPAALDSAEVTLLIDGVVSSCQLSLSGNHGPCSFTAGTQNQLLIVADATTHGAGLVGAKIVNGGTTLFAQTYAVGTLPQPASINLPATASDYQLRFTDIGTPAPLSSLHAVLVEGVDVIATDATQGAFNATQGTAQLYVVAIPDATKQAGIYTVQLSRSGTSLYANAVPVTSASTTNPGGFTFNFTAPASGPYKLNITDLAAPSALGQLYAILTQGSMVIANIYGGTTTASVTVDLTAGGDYVLNVIANTDTNQSFGIYGVSMSGSPVITLSADKSHVAAGQSVKLTWSTNDAASCSASGGWSGNKSVTGTETFGPINSSVALTLTCQGIGGTNAKTVNVNVDAASSGGGGGGGGSLSWAWLLGLAGLLTYQVRRDSLPC